MWGFRHRLYLAITDTFLPPLHSWAFQRNAHSSSLGVLRPSQDFGAGLPTASGVRGLPQVAPWHCRPKANQANFHEDEDDELEDDDNKRCPGDSGEAGLVGLLAAGGGGWWASVVVERALPPRPRPRGPPRPRPRLTNAIKGMSRSSSSAALAGTGAELLPAPATATGPKLPLGRPMLAGATTSASRDALRAFFRGGGCAACAETLTQLVTALAPAGGMSSTPPTATACDAAAAIPGPFLLSVVLLLSPVPAKGCKLGASVGAGFKMGACTATGTVSPWHDATLRRSHSACNSRNTISTSCFVGITCAADVSESACWCCVHNQCKHRIKASNSVSPCLTPPHVLLHDSTGTPPAYRDSQVFVVRRHTM